MTTSPARVPPLVPLVDIVTGSFGAGHDAAAGALARQLHDLGAATRTWDIVDLMPGRLGRLVRSGYLTQVQSMPGTWRWTLDQLDRRDRIAQLVTVALASTGRALLQLAEARPSMIVSTHPFASQALGALRVSGQLDAPVTTYLTDMSVHRLWIHPGVDRHQAIHDLPALEASALGARGVETVAPAVAKRFADVCRDARSRATARVNLGLPVDADIALVTGGSCGIGSLLASARDLSGTGLVTPVVLCGSNQRLLSRVRRTPGILGLGWVADMPSLLSAVDVVVQNSGGMTSLEALATQTPVVTYRCIPGHGETNAAALDTAGLVPWARNRGALAASLVSALREDRGPLVVPDLRPAASVLLPCPVLV